VGARVLVANSFEAEVARTFSFLMTEVGLSRVADLGSLVVGFMGDGFDYRVAFDEPGRAVRTTIGKDMGDVRLTADLPALVLGASLGGLVPVGAATMMELRATLTVQAGYVRRLQPYLTPLNLMPLMRAAHAREHRLA
jgi:hypothetical protein